MKLEKETALYNENAIANEVSNFTNEIVEINGGLQQLEQQIDGQVVTWFYNYTPTLNNLPASEWDSDEKELHLGDIFYNTTTYLAYIWSKSSSTYSWNRISNKDLTTALQKATVALDTADKKRRVFISTSSQQNPTPPYDYGDIWFQGEYYDKDILTCAYSDGRPDGASFVRNDWAKLNKYTDDSALTTFLNGTYSSDKTNLQSQIDKKAETWYQSGDPSTAWTTAALKAEHEGDLWYNTTDQKTCRYSKVNNVYSWQQENVPTEVFDKIDGKAAIYTSQPNPPYNIGDLWFNSASSDILTCMNPKTLGQQFVSADWVKRNKYTDDSYAQTLASRIGDMPQYFWHNESAVGDEGAGAHITEIPKEDFIEDVSEDPTSGGGNTLITSNGVYIRDGAINISSFEKENISMDMDGQRVFNYHSYSPEDTFIIDTFSFGDELDIQKLESSSKTLTTKNDIGVFKTSSIHVHYYTRQQETTRIIGVGENETKSVAGLIQLSCIRTNNDITITITGLSNDLIRAKIQTVNLQYSTDYTLASMVLGKDTRTTKETVPFTILGKSNSILFSVSPTGDVNFNGELTIKNHSSPIGTVRSISIDESISADVDASSSWKLLPEVDGLYLELERGVWLVNLAIHFGNTTGYRGVSIARKNPNTSGWSSYGVSNNMIYCSSRSAWLHTSATLFTYNIDITTVLPRLYVSNEGCGVYGYMQAVRLV